VESALDIEAVLCTIEDVLVVKENAALWKAENAQVCQDMAKSLMKSILDFRGIRDIERMLEDLELSKVKAIVSSITPSYLVQPSTAVVENFTRAPTQVIPPPSRGIAELVSTIGSVSDAEERNMAVMELRRYREINGDDELTAHLHKLSETFREYIWEQLGPGTAVSPAKSTASDMSERIRTLRSKLLTTDARATLAIAPPPSSPRAHKTPTKIPTPSRIPRPTPTGTKTAETASTVLSLRERLAAAHANRTKPEDGEIKAAPVGDSVSYTGHAAALRARLEAAKGQGKK
jgi:hypothetical protein